MSDTIREQIFAIRAEGATNMLDTRAVQRIALEKGFYVLIDFIETDRSAYARFILTGEAD